MRVQKVISAQNQWSDKFELMGDKHVGTKRARALLSIVQGTANSTVSLRRYDRDGTTVIQTKTYTAGDVIEVPVTGIYDVGVATGAFGTGAITVTIEQ